MRIRFLLLALIISGATYGQRVVHQSHHVLAINGSWDLTKDPKRAQFVSGNHNIQALFIKNYKLSVERLHRVKKGFVELEFIVKSDGKIDSISFLKHDDNINDLEAIRLLGLTDGAWRPGQIDGSRVSEKIVIRYFFSDNAKDKDTAKKMSEAKESFDKGSFNSCIKSCDQVLDINPFETEVLKLKAACLLNLGKKKESCEVLTLAAGYYAENIEELVANSCN